MEYTKQIEDISEKYRYSKDLTESLKRCVPAMIKDKSEEEIKLLMDTLERVEIFEFDEVPTKEQLDKLDKIKTNNANKHVKFNDSDNSEYNAVNAPSAYTTNAIFDENMNIVDRVGYIYLTKLNERDEAAKFYNSRVNLSHLVHELGHAWGAQKDEYVQKENGDYVCNIGSIQMNYKVDRENKTIEKEDTRGLYLEEALNTIEEEKSLCSLLNIKDVKEIPSYVPSTYQGLMKMTIQEYQNVIGEEPFSKMRILHDKSEIQSYENIIEKSESVKELKTKGRIEKKKETFDKVNDLEDVSDERKNQMLEFYNKHKDIFFKEKNEEHFFDGLDDTLQQLYNFNSIKYNFNIWGNDKNREIYNNTVKEILKEAYNPLKESKEKIIEFNNNKTKQTTVSMKSLTKQALQMRNQNRRKK